MKRLLTILFALSIYLNTFAQKVEVSGAVADISNKILAQ